MKSKYFIYVVITVIIIVALSYYFYDSRQRQAQAPSTTDIEKELMQDQDRSREEPQEQATEDPNVENEQQGQRTEGQGAFSSGNEAELAPGEDILVTEIVYDGQGFSPDSLEILAGDIVIFTNNSGAEFRPVSDAHPDFGPEVPILDGGKYQFKFEQVGAWSFYDALNAPVTGTVNVTAR